MDSVAAKHRLEKLRVWRKPSARSVSLETEISKIADDARRADRGLSRALQAWAAAAPVELVDCCRPTGLRAGTLELACDSSAAAYEVNRWLQGEGVAALAREGVAVLRVRLVGLSGTKVVQPKAGQPGKIARNGARRPRL